MYYEQSIDTCKVCITDFSYALIKINVLYESFVIR